MTSQLLGYKTPLAKLRVRICGLHEESSTFRGNKGYSDLTRPSLLDRPWSIPEFNKHTDNIRKRAYNRLLMENISNSSTYSHQFLLVVPSSLQLRMVKEHIVRLFSKLYPDEGVLHVSRLKDEHDCDLDDDYLVEEVFTEESIAIAICHRTDFANATSLIPDNFTTISSSTTSSEARNFLTPLSEVAQGLTKELPITDSSLEFVSTVGACRDQKTSSYKGATEKDDEANIANADPVTKKKRPRRKDPVKPTKETMMTTPTKTNVKNPMPKEIQTTNISEGVADTKELSPMNETTIEMRSPQPVHVAPLLNIPKSVSDFTLIMQKPESDSEDSEDSSSSDEDVLPTIPVVRSQSATSLNGNQPNLTIIQERKEVTPRENGSSSDESDNDHDLSSFPFTQPRTSLTELTEEVRRNSAPQPIKTKAPQSSKRKSRNTATNTNNKI